MKPVLVACALVILIAPLSGCAFRWGPEPTPIRFASASITDHDESAAYDALTMRASVTAKGSVRAEDASNVSVTAWLVARACPTGPASTPTDAADHATVTLGNVTSASYALRLNATLAPGTPYSVLAQAQPAGLGPAFPTCRSFVAAPAPAPPPAPAPVPPPAPAKIDGPSLASLHR